MSIFIGTKTGTIRKDRKRHARVGEEIQHYYGMRTKHCRLIGRATCRSVLPIRIDVAGGRIEFASGLSLTTIDELDAFAVTDGFADWPTMRGFWEIEHPGMPLFTGQHIRWVDFKGDTAVPEWALAKG